jgi:signal transduction histidine kinase
MIQELLTYSRLTLLEFQPQPIRLSRVIKDAVSQLAGELETRQVAVTIARSGSQVLGHYSMLVQAITHLVSNAVKFVPLGTTPAVRIYDTRDASFVRLWVEDNGIGIQPEHRDRIFRVFERLHDRDEYTGTGIGLAIVHKAASRMNGRVGVESEPGKGSRFWIELPLCPAPENLEEEVSPPT